MLRSFRDRILELPALSDVSDSDGDADWVDDSDSDSDFDSDFDSDYKPKPLACPQRSRPRLSARAKAPARARAPRPSKPLPKEYPIHLPDLEEAAPEPATPDPPVLAPLPDHATKLDLPGRSPLLPDVYLIQSHSLVRKPHGPIYLLVADYRAPAMRQLFGHAANQDAPTNADIERRGYATLVPSDNAYVVMRNKYGSGNDEDDKVVSWALSRADLSPVHVAELTKAREAAVGPKELLADGPPAVDTAGNVVGGAYIERGTRAVHLSSGRRCYPLGITTQVPKHLDAPARSNKVFRPSLDDEAEIRFNLLKVGAISSIQGLKKGPEGLLEALTVQSELVNIPRVGTDDNVIYSSFQLNIASPVGPDTVGSTGIGNLGRFGGIHIDSGDSSVPPTAMTILTEPHEDVEDEYFHLADLGLSWLLEEFSTLYFSGLHFHGGSQPVYKSLRTNPKTPGLRLTLIGYAAGDVSDGNNAVALGSDTAGQLVTLPIEAHQPKIAYVLGHRPTCTQATFITDGMSIFEASSQLRFLSRSLLLLAFRFVSQANPALLARIDRERFLSSFSCVVGNERVVAGDWELGPGWTGEDVEPGFDYTNILERLGELKIGDLPDTTLAQLWNSNNVETAAFFNNQPINDAIAAWDQHKSHSEANIPVCVIVANDNPLGGRMKPKRKVAVAAARRSPKKGGKHPHPDKANNQPTKGGKRPRADKGSVQPTKRVKIEAPLIITVDSDDDQLVDEPAWDVKDLMPGIEEGNTEGAKYDGTFLQDLHEAALTTALAQAETAIGHGQTLPAHPLTSDAAIDALCLILKSSVDGAVRINVEAVQRTNVQEKLLGWAKHTEQLLVDLILWEWLERQVEDSWRANAKDIGVRGSLHLFTLMHALDNYLAGPAITYSLDASNYLPGFVSEQSIYSLTIPKRRYSSANNPAVLFDVTFQVLAYWLGLADSRKGMPKAWYAREILDRIGIHALSVRAVTKAANQVNVSVLGLGRSSRVSKEAVERWAEEVLSKHALSSPLSRISELAQKLHLCLQQLAPLNEFLLAHIDDNRPARVSLPPPSPPPQRLSEDHVLPPVHCDEVQLARFCAMLENLYPLLDRRRARPKAKKTSQRPATRIQDAKLNYQDFVLACADKRLPFRDEAPSRRRILETNGPYAPANISTVSGLFSALVYRGISHNTTFLLENDTFFHTLSDFQELCTQLELEGHDSKYFCNKAAYGVTTNRSIDHAPVYWQKAQDKTLNGFLTQEPPINFLELFCVILLSKIPGFGPLTSFQLALDYAIAKKATMPTVREMAHIVFKLKLGGLKGLALLGYSVATEYEVACAIYSLRSQLEERIPTSTKKRISFGVIFIEHALCKFGRLDKKPFRVLEELIESGSHL